MRSDKCQCRLATRLVGDGCQYCNPDLHIEILEQRIENMRLTAEEREALEDAINDIGQYADEMALSATEAAEKQAPLRALLDRTK